MHNFQFKLKNELQIFGQKFKKKTSCKHQIGLRCPKWSNILSIQNSAVTSAIFCLAETLVAPVSQKWNCIGNFWQLLATFGNKLPRLGWFESNWWYFGHFSRIAKNCQTIVVHLLPKIAKLPKISLPSTFGKFWQLDVVTIFDNFWQLLTIFSNDVCWNIYHFHFSTEHPKHREMKLSADIQIFSNPNS